MVGSGQDVAEARRARSGVLYALAAFFMWGLAVPLHFKLLTAVPALQILAHRIVWASVFALGLIVVFRQWRKLAEAFASASGFCSYPSPPGLIAINWLIYIWAVNSGHLVQTSLGYFINPLLNVVLGVLFLRERLNPTQIAACLLAGLGVLVLAVASGEMPWVALAFACSFGCYGLVRKIVPVAPLVGFCIESLLLTPLALGYLVLTFVSGTSRHFRAMWASICCSS